MPALHVNRGIQTLKVGAATGIVGTRPIRNGNQKGPFRLVRVHVELLPLLFRDIVLDHVRFPIVEDQHLLFRTTAIHTVVAVATATTITNTRVGDVGHNGRHDRVNRLLDGRGQDGELSTPQRLLRVRVGRVLAAALLLRDSDNVVALHGAQTSVGYVNAVLSRHCHPVGDFLYCAFLFLEVEYCVYITRSREQQQQQQDR